MDRPEHSPWTPPDTGRPAPESALFPAPQPHEGYPQYAQGYGPWPPAYPPPMPARTWTAEPPPGTRYHQQARTPLHRWWRPLAGTLLIAVLGTLMLLAVGIVALLLYASMHDGRLPLPRRGQIFADVTANLAFELAGLGSLTPVVFLTAWLVQHRRPGTLSSVAGRLRWGWLAICCLLALGFLALSFGWSQAVTAMFTHAPLTWPVWKGWHTFLTPAIVIVALVPFQATAEEYLFRGWLVQAVASWVPTRWTNWFARMLSIWPALAISAVLFTLGHGYTGWGMLDTFLFGLLVGWLAVRTGGLEAGIALHVFNNLYAFLIPAAAGQLVDAMKQGGLPWQSLLSDLVPLVLYALAVLLVARIRRVQTIRQAG